MPEIAGQRLRRIGLTPGDIGGSLQPGKINPETELRGCPERIRTLESRDAWQTLGRLALNFHRRKEWTSSANGVSLSPCRDKGRLAHPGSCPAGDGATAGFGGDGAWCRCNRKGSSNVARQNPPERPRLRAPRAARKALRSLGPFPRVRPAARPQGLSTAAFRFHATHTELVPHLGNYTRIFQKTLYVNIPVQVSTSRSTIAHSDLR
jgi:hypothetical protein